MGHCRRERFEPNSDGLRRAGVAVGGVPAPRGSHSIPRMGRLSACGAGRWHSWTGAGAAKGLLDFVILASSAQDQFEGGRGGHLAAPGFEFGNPGVTSFLFQFVKADGQVAQCGQDLRRATVGCLTGVLAEGVVAPVMGAVLDRRPVVADDFEQFLPLPIAAGPGWWRSSRSPGLARLTGSAVCVRVARPGLASNRTGRCLRD